jgi:hypothetical protein
VKAIFEYWGRKGQAFFATVIALIIVGMADKQAAEAIGWCIVGAFGIQVQAVQPRQAPPWAAG